VITRPLDLASRLKPVARGWDTLFYVNTGALALFFLLFGSRYVLAPGLGVDFALPTAGEAATSTLITDVVIAVPAPGMVVVEGAVVDYAGLAGWLRTRVAGERRKRLLVQASASLPARDLAEIYALAADAGFSGVLIATNAAAGKR
jgi:biopolymer transport protein ExbD